MTDFRRIVRNSGTYTVTATVRTWAANSRTATLLSNQRWVLAVAAVVVSVSVLRVLSTGLDVAVKFLSFALLAVVLAAVTWRITDPGPETE